PGHKRPSYLVTSTRKLTCASGFIVSSHSSSFVDFVSKVFVPVSFRLIMSQEPEKQESVRTELYDALRKFAAQVKGPLVDVAIVPFITRDYILADYRNYSREGISAKWKQYADHIEQRESDQDKYAEVYGQYLRDEAQSDAAKAIRAGRAIP
ncbi:hypothetical protein B0H14DRAFT_2714689, partial [Mycena olivaceomarginata]